MAKMNEEIAEAFLKLVKAREGMLYDSSGQIIREKGQETGS